MTITWGKIQKYLGVAIDYSFPGKGTFSMVNHIVKIIDSIPEDMKVESATPNLHHLFDISEDVAKISRTDTDLFHHFMAQPLYLSKRARPDIHFAL